MSSRLLILGLAAAITTTSMPAAAQNCYLHVQNNYQYRPVGGVSQQCWQRVYVTTGTPTPPAGYQHVGAAGTRAGPGCVPFMASTTMTWSTQTNYICFMQTFNGSIQIAKPPGAW